LIFYYERQELKQTGARENNKMGTSYTDYTPLIRQTTHAQSGKSLAMFPGLSLHPEIPRMYLLLAAKNEDNKPSPPKCTLAPNEWDATYG
jgi:hypothetical protein